MVGPASPTATFCDGQEDGCSWVDASAGWELKGGPSFPSAVQTGQVRPLGRGVGGAPAPSLTSYPAHSQLLSQEFFGARRWKGVSKGFPKVMGPVLSPCPGRVPGPARRVVAGAGAEEAAARSSRRDADARPAQVRAQAGIPRGFTRARSPPAGGWPSAQQAQKTIYLPAPLHSPKDDQIVGLKQPDSQDMETNPNASFFTYILGQTIRGRLHWPPVDPVFTPLRAWSREKKGPGACVWRGPGTPVDRGQAATEGTEEWGALGPGRQSQAWVCLSALPRSWAH